ncbi:unnamed protein product [Protopolystoma xenopodis]|uniref:SWIM-type domain-containing protein n=1 Tax=Protopolystoma xenopodis TaxID=117903 RepID=A0A3S5AN17_9PLAT|nr:unnamed protein product [Protopolystoma xenopodis]
MRTHPGRSDTLTNQQGVNRSVANTVHAKHECGKSVEQMGLDPSTMAMADGCPTGLSDGSQCNHKDWLSCSQAESAPVVGACSIVGSDAWMLWHDHVRRSVSARLLLLRQPTPNCFVLMDRTFLEVDGAPTLNKTTITSEDGKVAMGPHSSPTFSMSTSNDAELNAGLQTNSVPSFRVPRCSQFRLQQRPRFCVLIGQQECTCRRMDNESATLPVGWPCQHVLFVLLRVLRVSVHDTATMMAKPLSKRKVNIIFALGCSIPPIHVPYYEYSKQEFNYCYFTLPR